MSGRVRIGYVQLTSNKSKDENIKKISEKIDKLAKDGAQVICLQELFSTMYFCDKEQHENFSLAESIPGDTTKYFQQIAKRLKVVLILPIFEKRTSGIYHNTAVVIDADGSFSGIYRKSHIPDDPGFYEKFYFTPGDTGYQVFKTRYAKISPLICWDQWFPEAARIASLAGAEIIFYPTAIGWDVNEKNAAVNNEQLQAWKTIQRAHAIANGVYVVSVNRVGRESGTKFWGSSFVSNPFGTLVYESPSDKEDDTVVEINLDAIEYYRTTWPFLRDRRVDNYDQILKRYLD